MQRRNVSAIRRAKVRRVDTSRRDLLSGLRQLIAARPDTVRLFHLFAKSCPKGRFSPTIPGLPIRLRKDQLHFTPRGAMWIAEDLGPVVVEEARRRRPS